MANFKLYPGLHVRILEDTKSRYGSEVLKAGEIVQILYGVNDFDFRVLTFVGKYGQYTSDTKMEPIYEEAK